MKKILLVLLVCVLSIGLVAAFTACNKDGTITTRTFKGDFLSENDTLVMRSDGTFSLEMTDVAGYETEKAEIGGTFTESNGEYKIAFTSSLAKTFVFGMLESEETMDEFLAFADTMFDRIVVKDNIMYIFGMMGVSVLHEGEKSTSSDVAFALTETSANGMPAFIFMKGQNLEETPEFEYMAVRKNGEITTESFLLSEMTTAFNTENGGTFTAAVDGFNFEYFVYDEATGTLPSNGMTAFGESPLIAKGTKIEDEVFVVTLMGELSIKSDENPDGYEVTGFDSSKLGNTTATISYKGAQSTVSFTVVEPKKIEYISFSNDIIVLPAGTDFAESEIGMSVYSYGGNEEEALAGETDKFTIVGEWDSTAGTRLVTFKFETTDLGTVIATKVVRFYDEGETIVEDIDLGNEETQKVSVNEAKQIVIEGETLDLTINYYNGTTGTQKINASNLEIAHVSEWAINFNILVEIDGYMFETSVYRPID